MLRGGWRGLIVNLLLLHRLATILRVTRATLFCKHYYLSQARRSPRIEIGGKKKSGQNIVVNPTKSNHAIWFECTAKNKTKQMALKTFFKKSLLAFKTTFKNLTSEYFPLKKKRRRNNAFAILTSYCTLSSTPNNITEEGMYR